MYRYQRYLMLIGSLLVLVAFLFLPWTIKAREIFGIEIGRDVLTGLQLARYGEPIAWGVLACGILLLLLAFVPNALAMLLLQLGLAIGGVVFAILSGGDAIGFGLVLLGFLIYAVGTIVELVEHRDTTLRH